MTGPAFDPDPAMAEVSRLRKALERAERERDESIAQEEIWAKANDEMYARAQKAEAVVEAARQLRNEGWFAPWSDHAAVQVILAALDEPPTRLGGIEGKHYAVGGRDAPPPEQEQPVANTATDTSGVTGFPGHPYPVDEQEQA